MIAAQNFEKRKGLQAEKRGPESNSRKIVVTQKSPESMTSCIEGKTVVNAKKRAR